MNWVGLIDGYGCSNEGESLALLNDNGKTFAKIAKIIRKEPVGLFWPIPKEGEK